MHKPAARSATGDFPPAGSSPSAAGTAFCRASSAPPVGPLQNDVPVGSPSSRRTFTTTVHHTPTMLRPSEQEKQQSSSPGPNRRPTPSSGGPTVRHIPILVEGRDEPVLPSVDEEDATAKEKRSKTAIPMPFYPLDSSAQQPLRQAPPPGSNRGGHSVVDGREKSPQGANASVPIPLPYDRLSDVSDSGRSVGSSSNDSGPALSADMELIQKIQKETETLLPRIEAFQGDRNDRGFLFLDEMYVLSYVIGSSCKYHSLCFLLLHSALSLISLPLFFCSCLFLIWQANEALTQTGQRSSRRTRGHSGRPPWSHNVYYAMHQPARVENPWIHRSGYK